MTRGRYALLAILSRTTGREVARRCIVSPSRVSEWGSGATRPSARARAALETCYGIDAAAWDLALSLAARVRIAELLR